MEILGRNPFRKLHRAAWSGTAICPFCYSQKAKILERIGWYVVRFQCKVCSMTYREDMTPEGHYGDDARIRLAGRPYASYKTLDQVLEQEKRDRGPKVEMKIGVHKFKK